MDAFLQMKQFAEKCSQSFSVHCAIKNDYKKSSFASSSSVKTHSVSVKKVKSKL